MKRCGWRGMAIAAAMVGSGALAPGTAAQQVGLPLELGGLLRTGLRIEPGSTGEADGFDIFDARASVAGEVGIVFDYFFQTEVDTDDEVVRLLDAKATLPIMSELVVSIGLFKAPFGLEALQSKGDLTFLERAQASEAIAPGRQVGVSVDGATFDGRLTWGAGLFNGNGRTLENDGNDFMLSGRVQYNSIGTIAFYEDFVIQAGASIGYSKDTAAGLDEGLVTGDPASVPELTAGFAGERRLLGGDVKATYREWSLTGEILRGDFDIDPGAAGGPDGGGEFETDAWGGYVELGYRAYGAIEGVLRFDGFDPAIGQNRDFLVAGLNVYPGHYAKFGAQYAFALHDSAAAPTLAGSQFILLAQLAF